MTSGREAWVAAGSPAGFDPEYYRWWDRWQCHNGWCGRGFNFHAMGLQHGPNSKYAQDRKKPEGR